MLHVFAISLLPSGDIVYDLAKKSQFPMAGESVEN